MLTADRFTGIFKALDASPWNAATGRVGKRQASIRRGVATPLYTLEERRRRDSTPWTLVQGILAPVQFLVFLVSLGLVVNYLATGHGYVIATVSIITKTAILSLIMVTGSIWEKVVFGRWLFAPAFFWEDVFSMLVLALHTAYLLVLVLGIGDGRGQMMLALAAYAAYVVNAAQFLLKLRTARREEAGWRGGNAGQMT
ncbi:MAG: 2-vinyl bacteriochlorophyllide hydratase [Alphaproteobacteria bacterium]|nr:2-vinyl bacteriochlorophyllide hydratase [Alphaproteobacteria bacterium]